MPDTKTQKKTQGFSLIELMLVVSVIMILAAVTVPGLVKTVSDISLRYTASDLASLLQTARMQAVKRNTFYSVQPGALPSGQLIYYMDKPGTAYVNGDPIMPIGQGVTLSQGAGSGAPNETAFLASLAFPINPSTAAPSFNARGLPCIGAPTACPTNTTNGFVVFMKKGVRLAILPGLRSWSTPADGCRFGPPTAMALGCFGIEEQKCLNRKTFDRPTHRLRTVSAGCRCWNSW